MSFLNPFKKNKSPLHNENTNYKHIHAFFLSHLTIQYITNISMNAKKLPNVFNASRLKPYYP